VLVKLPAGAVVDLEETRPPGLGITTSRGLSSTATPGSSGSPRAFRQPARVSLVARLSCLGKRSAFLPMAAGSRPCVWIQNSPSGRYGTAPAIKAGLLRSPVRPLGCGMTAGAGHRHGCGLLHPSSTLRPTPTGPWPA
jgi:hypothetical protein